jgi:pimeloyl-ACP methyl ester carboxylesterase
VLPGTGHTLNLEEPAAFNDAVLQFLREVED